MVPDFRQISLSHLGQPGLRNKKSRLLKWNKLANLRDAIAIDILTRHHIMYHKGPNLCFLALYYCPVELVKMQHYETQRCKPYQSWSKVVTHNFSITSSRHSWFWGLWGPILTSFVFLEFSCFSVGFGFLQRKWCKSNCVQINPFLQIYFTNIQLNIVTSLDTLQLKWVV